MELDALRQLLDGWGIPGDGGGDGPEEAARWLAALEAADPGPAPARHRALVLALDDLCAVWEEPFPVPGARRGELVRWDPWTSTWTATDGASATPLLLRTLRPAAARRPAAVRAFRREVAALQRVCAVSEGDGWVGVVMGGWAAGRLGGRSLARSLGTGLSELERWAAAGLAPVAPGPEELRTDGTGRVWLAVTTLADDVGPAVAALFARIDPEDDGPLADALRVPPTALPEARARWIRALAAELAGQRHQLVERWRSGRQADRRGRLRELAERLQAAVPPPVGLGAVGVDLDGRITVVRSTATSVSFGPAESPEVVWDPAAGFRPPVVRRLLRSRAMSPPNPVLDARVGGDPATTEAVCRWVAEGARLRTLRMLLGVDG